MQINCFMPGRITLGCAESGLQSPTKPPTCCNESRQMRAIDLDEGGMTTASVIGRVSAIGKSSSTGRMCEGQRVKAASGERGDSRGPAPVQTQIGRRISNRVAIIQANNGLVKIRLAESVEQWRGTDFSTTLTAVQRRWCSGGGDVLARVQAYQALQGPQQEHRPPTPRIWPAIASLSCSANHSQSMIFRQSASLVLGIDLARTPPRTPRQLVAAVPVPGVPL
jgi:hypothetical protein